MLANENDNDVSKTPHFLPTFNLQLGALVTQFAQLFASGFLALNNDCWRRNTSWARERSQLDNGGRTKKQVVASSWTAHK